MKFSVDGMGPVQYNCRRMDVFDIIANLTSGLSREKMERHMAEPDFTGVWSTFMVLHALSHSRKFEDVADAQAVLERMDDPKSVYRALFAICSASGRCACPVYVKSPFRK